MGKLFRSVHSENIRLYASSGALLSLIVVFIIALCSAWVIGANSGERDLLGFGFSDAVNSQDINIPTEYAVMPEEQLQEVISSSDISDSDVVSDETENEIFETRPYDNWRDAYTARYDELLELDRYYSQLIDTCSGSEEGYYCAKQQEGVREAFIINYCLKNDTPIGCSKGWNVVYLTIWLMLLPIAIIVSSAISGKTAGEYRSGVAYTLYTLPVTRLKQYFAKLLSVSLFALMLTAIAWAGSIFGAMLGCGGLKYEGSFIRVLGTDVTATSFFAHSVELAAGVLATVFILIAFCAAVSTLTHSQGAAMSLTALLTVGAMIFGKTLGCAGNIFAGISVIAVLDISAPLRSIPNYPYASYVVSWLCAAVYWLVFVVGGYIGVRRDVR